MFKQNIETAELFASRVPTAEILAQVGTWHGQTRLVGETFITRWTCDINGETYEIESGKPVNSNIEEQFLSFVKGGPITLPMKKLDFIAHFLFDGDFTKASAFAEREAKKNGNWLNQLGRASRFKFEKPIDIEFSDIEFAKRVEDQKTRLLSLDAARDQIAEERFSKQEDLPVPKILSEWLLEEDEELTFRFDQLWPTDGTVFLVAAYKAGKTTVIMNVIRSLIDGVDFLGRFDVEPVLGNVGFINFEVNAKQGKAWLSRLKLSKPEKLFTWNLKGYGSPFDTKLSRLKFIDSLIECGIEVLIIDPFSGAFRTGDSNHNDEVKSFLLELDEVARLSGVREILMAVHAGKDQDSPRGASSLGDHPDAIWTLTKGGVGKPRFFKAEGRDVLVLEECLELAEDKVTLSLNGKSKAEAVGENFEALVEKYISLNPGCNAGQIEAGITGKSTSVASARKKLVQKGVVIEIQAGNSKTYKLSS